MPGARPYRSAATDIGTCRRTAGSAHRRLYAGAELVARILPDTAARAEPPVAVWWRSQRRRRAVWFHSSRPVARRPGPTMAAMVPASKASAAQPRSPASVCDAVGKPDPARMGAARHVRHARSGPLSARRGDHVSCIALPGHECAVAPSAHGRAILQRVRGAQSRRRSVDVYGGSERTRLARRSAAMSRSQFPAATLSRPYARFAQPNPHANLARRELILSEPRWCGDFPSGKF